MPDQLTPAVAVLLVVLGCVLGIAVMCIVALSESDEEEGK